MTNLSSNKTGVLLATLFAFSITSCSFIKKPKSDSNEIFSLSIDDGYNLEWLHVGEPIQFIDFLYVDTPNGRQTLLNTPDQCGVEIIQAEAWRNRNSILESIFATAVDTTDTNSLANDWISSSPSNRFRVAFTNKDSNAKFSGTLNSKIANATVGSEFGLNELRLILGYTQKSVALKSGARSCVQANVCLLSNNQGGSYVSRMFLGSLIELNIIDGLATVTSTANIEGKSIPASLDLDFDLSSNNLSIVGGVLGRVGNTIQNADGIKEIYDIDSMVVDLQDRQLLTVYNNLRALTEKLEVVAIETEEVSSGQCN